MNEELQLVVIVSARNTADKIVKSVSGNAFVPFVVRGKGTAPNSVLQALGLGEPEKDVIFCFSNKKDVPKIYSVLSKKFKFQKNKTGIAMSIPVSAVGGKLTYDLLLGNSKNISKALGKAQTDKEKKQ